MNEKKIFLNTFYQIIGKIFVSLFGLISISFLTRYFDKTTNFSEYSLAFSFVGLTFIFADFGLGTLLTRNIASGKERSSYFSQIFTLRVILSTVVILFSFLLVMFLPYTNEVKIGILIVSFSNLFLTLSSTIWSVFQVELKFSKIVIVQIVSSLISFILIILGVFMKLDLFYFLSVSVVSSFAGLIISVKLNKYKEKLIILDFDRFKKIIKESLPFALGLIASVGYLKIDSVILSFYYNPSYTMDVGIYAIAYKIFEVVLVFGGFFSQTLFPFFSGIKDKKIFLKSYKKYFIYTLILSIGSAVFIFLFSDPLIQILGGDNFGQAIYPLKILSLAGGITVLSGFFLNIALCGYKEVLVFKFSLIAFFTNVVLNIIFIPKFSYIGASWITVATQLFILFSNMIAAYLVVREYNN